MEGFVNLLWFVLWIQAKTLLLNIKPNEKPRPILARTNSSVRSWNVKTVFLPSLKVQTPHLQPLLLQYPSSPKWNSSPKEKSRACIEAVLKLHSTVQGASVTSRLFWGRAQMVASQILCLCDLHSHCNRQRLACSLHRSLMLHSHNIALCLLSRPGTTYLCITTKSKFLCLSWRPIADHQ